MPAGPVLEVCVASADMAAAAARAGADRVELCANLVEGGTTPSLGAVSVAVERCGVPVMVMIRPRGGDFLYDDVELAEMLRDIHFVKEAGAAGAVLGVLRADGTVDIDRTKRLVEAAQPMAVTFHRAFDLSRDLFESLEAVLQTGVDRVLTSAGRATVLDGLDVLERLAARAGDELAMLPGGGVRPANVAKVLAVPGVREVHVGGARMVDSPMSYRSREVVLGRSYQPDEYVREEAHLARIGELKRALADGAGAVRR